jgi:2-polyprenyl-3-methyl-5-hydroxy-6-metoxy-1,4-benzoquinol methylase
MEKGRHSMSRTIKSLSAEYAAEFTGLRTAMIRHRPAICPFDVILDRIPEGASHLDIGCGSGFLLFASSRLRNSGRLAGVEADAALVEAARKALLSLVPSAHPELVATVDSSHWPSGQFDVVTLIDVLHHVPPQSQLEFLTDVASRVAPGGILIYKDIADTPSHYALANRMHDLVVAREWINYVPMETVVRQLRSAGLEPEPPTSKLTWWYLHEFTVARKAPLM